MSKRQTVEKQYRLHVAHDDKYGAGRMGLTGSYLWHHDPRHLLFTLSRYKFVAKVLEGKKLVAELGCGDAFGTRLVATTTKHVDGYDFDPVFIENARAINVDIKNVNFFVHDLLKKPLPKKYEAAFALDVIEHIQPRLESKFMKNALASLLPQGVLIMGSPSLESQKYASQPSKEGHVNCKTSEEMRQLLQKYFHNVFIFSMNDEVVHTGYGPMAHYLFGVGVGKK